MRNFNLFYLFSVNRNKARNIARLKTHWYFINPLNWSLLRKHVVKKFMKQKIWLIAMFSKHTGCVFTLARNVILSHYEQDQRQTHKMWRQRQNRMTSDRRSTEDAVMVLTNEHSDITAVFLWQQQSLKAW